MSVRSKIRLCVSTYECCTLISLLISELPSVDAAFPVVNENNENSASPFTKRYFLRRLMSVRRMIVISLTKVGQISSLLNGLSW